jgi:hypothetical protein
MEFSYNDLKVLKSLVQEFDKEEFEIFKTCSLFCLKVWFDFEYLQSLTSLSLSEGKISDHYVVFNLDKDEELQVNFKKTIVEGDRLFDIIKKPKKQLKSIKLILQVVKDKKLFKNFENFDKVSREKAIELSKDSHGIFEDQRVKDVKNVEKLKANEKEPDERQVLEITETKTPELVENSDSSDVTIQELTEISQQELGVIISYKLGVIRKMIEKRVFTALIKSIYKYFIKHIILTTLSTIEEKNPEVYEHKTKQQLLSHILEQCKNVGYFNKITKGSSPVKNSNPYIEFGKAMRPKIKEQHPEMSAKDIFKTIAQMWRERKQ